MDYVNYRVHINQYINVTCEIEHHLQAALVAYYTQGILVHQAASSFHWGRVAL